MFCCSWNKANNLFEQPFVSTKLEQFYCFFFILQELIFNFILTKVALSGGFKRSWCLENSVFTFCFKKSEFMKRFYIKIFLWNVVQSWRKSIPRKNVLFCSLYSKIFTENPIFLDKEKIMSFTKIERKWKHYFLDPDLREIATLVKGEFLSNIFSGSIGAKNTIGVSKDIYFCQRIQKCCYRIFNICWKKNNLWAKNNWCFGLVWFGLKANFRTKPKHVCMQHTYLSTPPTQFDHKKVIDCNNNKCCHHVRLKNHFLTKFSVFSFFVYFMGFVWEPIYSQLL